MWGREKRNAKGKTMTKLNGTYCGMFYNNAQRERYIGDIWKVGSKFVIRSVEYGRILWESAEFCGNEFRKIGSLNLGYAKETHYTSRA